MLLFFLTVSDNVTKRFVINHTFIIDWSYLVKLLQLIGFKTICLRAKYEIQFGLKTG